MYSQRRQWAWIVGFILVYFLAANYATPAVFWVGALFGMKPSY